MAHVTFIHGMLNKPAADTLLGAWRYALRRDGGIDLGGIGVSSSMVYWADVLYAEPEDDEAAQESAESLEATAGEDVDLSWQQDLQGEEASWTARFRRRLAFDTSAPDGDDGFRPGPDPADASFERIPLPWWLKRRIMKSLLRDVHHYLFNTEHSPRPGDRYRVRDEIRERTIRELRRHEDRRPHLVVSHSMGTIIAYDCLKRVEGCPPVDGLLTIGSPLGIDEIQDRLRPGWSRDDGFPSERLNGRWLNVFDLLDPVAAPDARLANDYRRERRPTVEDLPQSNGGRWRHGITKYLGGAPLRGGLGELLSLGSGHEAASLGASGAAGDEGTRDPETFVDRLRGAVAAYDRPGAEALCAELVERLGRSSAPYPEDAAATVLGILRRKRFFGLMQDVAEGLVAGGQRAFRVRRQYAQAMIDQGLLSPAISVLEQLVGETPDGSRENLESRGLLGRAYKQRYVGLQNPDTPQARDALNRAVRWYGQVYREDPRRAWHGINAVALLARAARDGVPIEGVDDPAATSRGIASRLKGELTRRWDRGDGTLWDAATAAEAAVALDRADEALSWTVRYVEDPRSDAFELASTLRQLTEVWQLRPSSEPGGSLLPLLRGELLRREGGELDLPAGESLGEQGGSLADRDREQLEKVLGTTRYQSIGFLLDAVARARAVARIETPQAEGYGTGFLVRGSDLHPSLGEEVVAVTNAHVVSDDPRERDALHPSDATVAFRFPDSGSGQVELAVTGSVWSSPSWLLDAHVLRVEAPPSLPDPMPLSTHLPTMGPGEDEQRIYVIGHPRGGALSVSLQDNLLLDHEGPPGGRPPNPEVRRIHYRSPTDPGSSGSPVFNRMWKLVGLHHAGARAMPRLNGRPGTYPANEGIWIESIREALAKTLGGTDGSLAV